jgi:pilus assembly protein CpaF
MEHRTMTGPLLSGPFFTPRPSTATNGGPDPKLAARIRDEVVSRLDPQLDLTNPRLVRRTIEGLFAKILVETGAPISRVERLTLFEEVLAEITGLGPIEPLLRDDSVTEIMINGPGSVYVERRGKIEETPVRFQSEEHLLRIIERIVAPIGRRVDEASPMVDARLADGSRVNVTIPPISLVGPVVTIRKFARTPYTDDNLRELGTLTDELIAFCQACVKARLNLIISGGTGTGKTTLLNVLSGYIPESERIITIEDAAELQLRQKHVVTLESRPPNVEGKGRITVRDLVINALRMRPDRIIVGEVRGGEALDMLQAMNTGHDGSMSTLHANAARDGLRRLETMVLMSGMDLPLRAIREQIAHAIECIIHLERMADGSRRVVQVAEVHGMEGDVILMQDIFLFERTGLVNGRIQGRLKPTGIRPAFAEKLRRANVELAASLFGLTLDSLLPKR